MVYRIISHDNIDRQMQIDDFNGMPAFEEIDLRTPEGRQRYKEVWGCRPNNRGTNYRPRGKRKEKPSKLLEDVRFLSTIYNERDRRFFAGFLANVFNPGGIQKAAKLTGLDVKTVQKGKKELKRREQTIKARIRREGGGRTTKAHSDPRYERELKLLIEDDLAGDPMGEKKWVRKTLRWMKKELQKKGIKVSIYTIRDTLKSLGVSLKKNEKYEGTQNHPDREVQFQYLNKFKRLCLTLGIPIISADAKKKELIGNFKNDGRTWRTEAYKVMDHDFPSLAEGKLIPFGIYDLQKNEGHVYCGTAHETPEFAVDCICKWWEEYGQKAYPNHSALLILCDSGGANGYRLHAWKWFLQTKLADRFGLTLYVCHYPSGASKYNPVEHKLFSFISINWAGEPLTSNQKALGLIRSTITETGLKVGTSLMEKEYETGIKISKAQVNSLQMKRAKTCPQWNYCITPHFLGERGK